MKPSHSNDSLAALERNATKAEAMLKSLANVKRLMILCHLVKSEKIVGELADLVGLSHSALSQHLAKIRENDLVVSDKRGQQVYIASGAPKWVLYYQRFI